MKGQKGSKIIEVIELFIKPLKQVSVPNTETMRALSRHYKTSVVPYEEQRQFLSTNQKQVSENWQGDGSNAYTQINGLCLSADALHVEQMKQVSVIFDQTAQSFDEGDALQKSALQVWEAAKTAAELLQYSEALGLLASAQQIQLDAQALIETARTYFHAGLTALTAQINSQPSLASTHALSDVSGASVPQPWAQTLPLKPPRGLVSD